MNPTTPPPPSKRGFFKSIGYVPHPGQEQIHAAIDLPDVDTVIAACGARFGKTMGAGYEMAFQALRPRPDFMGWCVAPTHDLANVIFDYVRGILVNYLDGKVSYNKQEGLLEFKNLGGGRSRIMRRTAENATGKAKLVGYAVDFMVIDEASGIPHADIWENQLRTRLIDRLGKSLHISTPRGKHGYFAALHRSAANDGSIISIRLPSWTNPHLNRKRLLDDKRRMPARAFAQEYGAEFIAASGQVFDGEALEALAIGDFEEPRPDASYFSGFDIAMTRDYSVVVVMRAPLPGETPQRPKVVFIQRWHRLPIQVQVERLRQIQQRFNDCCTIVDASGLGKPIVSMMRAEECNIRPVVWTAPSKRAMVNNTVALIDRGHVTLPKPIVCPAFWDEMSTYLWHETPNGGLTATAPEGMNDDTVSAFLMACKWIPAGGAEQGGGVFHSGTTAQERREARNQSGTPAGFKVEREGRVDEETQGGAWTQRRTAPRFGGFGNSLFKRAS